MFFCSEDRISSLERDRKIPFDGKFGLGFLYLDFSFCYCKLFTLYAVLWDLAGVVRTHSGKEPATFHSVRRNPKSCLLCHVSWLISYFIVKLYLPSILTSVKAWRNLSGIAKDFEPAGKSIVKELRIFIAEIGQRYSFPSPKNLNLQNRAFLCASNFHRVVWNGGCLEYSDLIRDVNAGCFPQSRKKTRFWAIQSIMRFQSRMSMVTLIFKIMQIPRQIKKPAFLIYPIRHKTTFHRHLSLVC